MLAPSQHVDFAPRTLSSQGTGVSIKFNPLGKQLRNVKCLKCGEYGHQRGDRECKMGGWDPFSGRAPVVAGVEGHYGPSGGVGAQEDDEDRLKAARKFLKKKVSVLATGFRCQGS